MNIVRGFNQAVAFLLEIVMVISLAYGGYHVVENVYLKYIVAIILPVIAIVFWSIFAAPKSTLRLEQPWRMMFRLAFYLTCTMLLYTIEKTTVAISLASVAIVNEIIAFYFND